FLCLFVLCARQSQSRSAWLPSAVWGRIVLSFLLLHFSRRCLASSTERNHCWSGPSCRTRPLAGFAERVVCRRIRATTCEFDAVVVYQRARYLGASPRAACRGREAMDR